MERPDLCAAPGEELALSLSQCEVWLDQRAWPNSSHLNIGGGAFLVGALDLPRLRWWRKTRPCAWSPPSPVGKSCCPTLSRPWSSSN